MPAMKSRTKRRTSARRASMRIVWIVAHQPPPPVLEAGDGLARPLRAAAAACTTSGRDAVHCAGTRVSSNVRPGPAPPAMCKVRVGKANSTSSCSSDIHYPQQDVLTLSQLGGDVSDLKKEVNKDIETAVAEIVETDPDVFLVGYRMIGKELLDLDRRIPGVFRG